MTVKNELCYLVSVFLKHQKVSFLKAGTREVGLACVTVGFILYGTPILLPGDSIVYRKMHNPSAVKVCLPSANALSVGVFES